MRNLQISKSGIWQFRYQIPVAHRHLFSNRYEIKRSLRTSDKQVAIVKALQLELEIRIAIQNNQPLTTSNMGSHEPALAAILVSKAEATSLNPFKCLEMYRDSKRDLVNQKTIDMAYAKCHIVLTLIKAKNIKEIRRFQAEQARNLLNQYPLNATKYKQLEGLKGQQLIEANEKHKLPTLSSESVKDYIQKCSSFFEWCLHMEMTDINPFKGMRFKKTRKDSEAKKAYNHADLKIVFGTEIHTHKKYKHPHYYWLPLLGLFTGARLNELCQLYRQDIYKKDGIWVIKVDDKLEGQRLKNNTSRRLIPIHKKLLELGFIEYVNSVQHERVFPALKEERDGFGAAASKWFGRFKTKLGFGRGHDFHSFRHTVATQLKNADISPVIAGELLGHAQNNITYDRYGKSVDIHKLKKIIDMLNL
ncbi:site-specific integrase [Vibrio parahaemolyticus]|uniref:site-specific integrase n=1 Tax=Vibrio parahaemolyticus TaxID=670 RepID=UPI000C9C778D|nr:site-specific integrase [Vibrio parahaemolyticus]MDK9425245.1 site-specific integrase [Vibrio parahaemolyticus]MDK9432300.1 site-specific integrase [Vibrio parahaemolyticus]MDK9436812.1 site-specific integrase [Vibrio parahaemolyticus]